MASSSQRASSSVPSALEWKYDVFLSFRGADTRLGFTDQLYNKLKEGGITRTFLDDDELQIGSPISDLFPEIEKSRLAIVVISPDYASSKWCLNELVTILKCMQERRAVIPVFYSVKPSDVGDRSGIFGNGFTKLEQEYEDDKEMVDGWIAALKIVEKIKGPISNNEKESDVIKKIVEKVRNEVGYLSLEPAKKLVENDSKLQQLDVHLELESNDVLFIGIWGMSGVGKTTLAKAYFERNLHKFDVKSFRERVREDCKAHGVAGVQRKLSNSLMNRNIQDWNAGEAVRMRYFLLEEKVLIVLDDVDNSEQLNELCGIPAWFGKGSRIIITTTNEQLLISHGIERRFEVRGWSDVDALKLFCLRAFNRENPPETYLNLSKSFVTYANGLPLALEVLGSLMKGKSRGVWNSKLSELKNNFDGDIMKTLKIGYEGLDPRQKDIFLDIACFFKGEDKDRVFEILDSCCGFKPDFDIDVLMKKSLITVSDNMVWMHDLLQKMGQAIVGQQSKQPGGRSRLWLSKDIFRVLKENTGTPTVEGIVLDLLESKEVNPEAFSQMVNLRLLKVHNVHLPDGLNRLPKSLRFLEWRGYPLRYLPPGFDPEDLGELSMCHSRIEQLWKGKKNFDKLKIIKVSHSKSLTRTPDFEGMQNLERLDFEGCESLVQVHSSIGTLKKLTSLNLSGNHFVSLPTSISQLLKLENLYLSCCTRLQRLPVPSSEVNLQVIADDCNSLEMLQFPSDLNKLKFSCFSFINCSRMLKKERYNPITLTVLQRYLKGDPYAGDRYEIVMPGNEIPWWFTHQRMGPEVSVNLTPQWHDKWMGYALCAVFQVSGKGWEISAILEVNGKEKYPAPLLSSDVQPVSDHIWLVYVSRGISFGTEWQNSCDQLNFLFKSSGPCLVKSCGTRLVYESDVEELDDIATQSRRNVDEERDESDVEELDDIATQSRRNVDEERDESDVEELDGIATQSRRNVDEERVGCWVGCWTLIQRLIGHYS